MPIRLETSDAAFETAFAAFLRTRREAAADVSRDVAHIVDDVRRRGDAAVVACAERFDGQILAPETLRVPEKEMEQVAVAAPAAAREALAVAARRIEAYHRRQVPEDLEFEDRDGVTLGHRWTPIPAVGLYVPGGSAAYPSTVLMTAIPARIACVDRIAMTVPAAEGGFHPMVAVAAALAGVTEVYRIGGAHRDRRAGVGDGRHTCGRQDRRSGKRLRDRGQTVPVRRLSA